MNKIFDYAKKIVRYFRDNWRIGRISTVNIKKNN